MSTFDRFTRLVKSYMNDVSDRIAEIDRSKAARELETVDRYEPRNMPSEQPVVTQTNRIHSSFNPLERDAFKVLGVPDGCDFALVRSAYFKLIKRADPTLFPPGSEEAKQAESIRRRVDHAYNVLRERFDPTADRFRNLDIE